MKKTILLIAIAFAATLIQQLPAQNLSNKDLIAHYRFNYDLKDNSGNNNHGSPRGGLTYGEDRFGNACGALVFNGSDSYVWVPTSPSLESPVNELTVTVWFKLEATADPLKWLTVVCKSELPEETPTSPQYRMQSTRVTLSMNTDFTENLDKDIAFNQWYHYAMVYDGKTVRAYLNGLQFFEFEYYTRFGRNSYPLNIGRDIPGNPEYFDGFLDDLRIYNRALSPREITHIYQDNTERTTTLPCPGTALPPEITLVNPPTNTYTTTTSTINLQATIKYVDDKRDISFEFNGKKLQRFRFDPNTDDFSIPLDLKPGPNPFTIIATNSVGKDEEIGQLILQGPKQPPVVTITEPGSDPFRTTSAVQTIQARIEHVGRREDIDFRLNGRPNANFTFDPATGLLKSTIRLSPGANNILITGTNPDGQDTDSGTIIFEQAKNPPVITVLDPTANPHISTVAFHLIKAKIEHIADRSGITFRFNGQNRTDFSFDPRTQLFSCKVDLIQGYNAFEITAENSDGKDRASGGIQYNPAAPRIQPPVVTVLSPTPLPHKSEQSVQKITARIDYVDNRQGVTFRINGQPKTDFTFDPGSGQFSIDVALLKGQNAFEITGTNQDGEDSKTGILLYEPQVVRQPPIITVLNPAQDPYKAGTADQTIKATILHITSKADVRFAFNGQPTTSFTYNPSTREFLAQVKLQQGYNTFDIVATNKDGQDQASGQIVYAPGGQTVDKPDPGKITLKETIFVKSAQIELVCYDHSEFDGDMVSLLMNGEVLLYKQVLRTKDQGPIRKTINVVPNKDYILVSKAHNVGTVPPNTMTIEIYDSGELYKKITLESEIGKSEAIRIIYDKQKVGSN